MTLTRAISSLPEELESLIETTIGALIVVHRQLGPGMSEGAYSAACRLELAAIGMPFEHEKSFAVRYRNVVICHQRVDVVVDQRLILELKSVERLHPVHVAQLVSYLRLAQLRAGLLVNFNVPILKQGIRRVVL